MSNLDRKILRYEILFAILAVAFFLLISSAGFADDDTSGGAGLSNQGGSGSSQEKQQEEKKSEEQKKDEEQKTGDEQTASDDATQEQTSSDEEKSVEETKEQKTGRDLKELFDKAKQKGALGEILKKEEEEKKKKQEEEEAKKKEEEPVEQIIEEDIVGPPLPSELKPEKPAEEEIIGPPLPDINMPLPPIEEEATTGGMRMEISFENAVPPEGRKYLDLSADKITRDKLKNQVLLEGNAKVVYEDVIILSEFAEFNDEEDWGKFWGPTGVLAENDEGVMKCDKMDASFKDKVAKLHTNIEMFVYGRDYPDPLAEDAPRKERLKRALGQEDTTVYCDEATYDWGNKIFHGWVEASDLVKIVQEGRHAYAKAVYHEKETDYSILEGKVELWQKDGNWLFTRDVVTDKDDKWANALLKPETTITCDVLESDGEKEITTLEGNVLAVQKDKNASADKVVSDDKEKILTAEGNVKAHQENGDWLLSSKIVDPAKESKDTLDDLKKPADGQADKFTLWTEKEDFEAEGNVKAWQEHQEAKTDKAVYKKEFDSLQVFGNVEIHREKTKNLYSDKGILWLTTKVYEAFGNVKSEGNIDVEKERDKTKSEEESSETPAPPEGETPPEGESQPTG